MGKGREGKEKSDVMEFWSELQIVSDNLSMSQRNLALENRKFLSLTLSINGAFTDY